MMAEGMRDCGSSQRGALIVLPWMRPSPPIHRPLSGLANLATLAAAMAIRVLQVPVGWLNEAAGAFEEDGT